MVQTIKGGVAPKPEKAEKATDKVTTTPDKTQAPAEISWVDEHPDGPASPSEAYNSGS